LQIYPSIFRNCRFTHQGATNSARLAAISNQNKDPEWLGVRGGVRKVREGKEVREVRRVGRLELEGLG